MELRDIKKSLSDMSEDELYAQLSTIRSSRRISKKPPAPVKKAAAVKKEVPTVSADNIIKTMSPDQAAALLKMMGG